MVAQSRDSKYRNFGDLRSRRAFVFLSNEINYSAERDTIADSLGRRCSNV